MHVESNVESGTSRKGATSMLLKTLIFGMAALLLFVFLPTSLSAATTGKIDVHIPFTFHLEGEQMPAGKYMLMPVLDELSDSSVMRIEGPKGEVEATVLATPWEDNAPKPSESADPKLVFEQLGTENHLAHVHFPRRSLSWTLTVNEEVEAQMKSEKSRQTTVEGKEMQ